MKKKYKMNKLFTKESQEARAGNQVNPGSKLLVLGSTRPAKTSLPNTFCNNGMGFDIKVVNSTFKSKV